MKCDYRLVVVVAVLLLTLSLAAQNTSGFDAAGEAQILAALNQSRAEAGVPPLKLDPKLTDAARNHALLLAKHHVLSHQFSGEPPLTERLRSTSLIFTAAAENVGMNTQLDDVNDMFMRSPGHRANMLNSAYDGAGIGVVHIGSSYWITEDFAKLTPDLSAQKAEDEVAADFEARWKGSHSAVLKRVTVPSLHTFSCDTARGGGKLQAASVLYGDKPARQLFGYSTADPASVAAQVNENIPALQATTYAVAACTPQEWGSAGQFWIVLALF